MEPIEREMTLRDYWRVVARRKWLVILSLVLAVGTALGLSLAQTPIYAASSEVLVQPRSSGSLFDVETGTLSSSSARTIETEIQVVEGETVRARVQEDLGLEELPPPADASAVGDTDVIEVSVRNEVAATARALADAYALAYIEVRREQSVNELLAASGEVQEKVTELQAQIDALPDDDPRASALVAQQANFEQMLDQLQVDAALRTGGASIIAPAELPTDPVEPEPERAAMLAGVVGLLVGLGAAFLVDYLDASVKREEDLARLTTLPVLATVPVDKPPDDQPISVSQPDDYAVETYRGLRTNLQFLGLDRSLRVIQCTSSIAGEGKTTTATNLAVVLARAGHRVVVVDADLRRPRLHKVFPVEPMPGLTDVLLGESVDRVVRSSGLGDGAVLDVVPCGDVPPNPSELLSNQRARLLLTELSGRYDYVVVDSAPILPVADSVALANAVDGVVLVVQVGRVTSANVVDSLERLQRVNAPVVGLVLNQATAIDRSGYRYGGYGSPRGRRAGTGSSAAPREDSDRIAEAAVPDT